MPEFCTEWSKASFFGLLAWQSKMEHVQTATQIVEIVSWFAGLVLIFGWRRREAKSRFIWILWTLLTLVNLIMIVQIVLDTKMHHLADEQDFDKLDSLSSYYNELTGVNWSLVTITHWFFAVKYFEIVFEFPLIFAAQDENIRAKRRKLRCMIWSANASYYALIGLWFLVWNLAFAYPLSESWDTHRVYRLLQILYITVIKTIPAGLLVFAIQKLRRSIKDFRGFSVRERLMFVHTVVFIFSICISVAYSASSILSHKVDAWSPKFRSYVSNHVFYEICLVSNVAILWLVIFMSLQLIKPLTREWRDSVSSYQGDALEQIRQSQFAASASRIQSAALEDANRSIRFLQALIDREDSGYESLQASLRESVILLNNEEATILIDSEETDTSSMKFARVRREEAERMVAVFGSTSVNDTESVPHLSAD